jgi:hypothetical protein
MRRLEVDAKSRGGKPMPKDFTDTMSKVMTGITYGGVLLTVAGIVVINGLLAYQMSRPHIREYLASVSSQQTVIPGYDPSMGLLNVPGVPSSGAAPPGTFPSQTQVPPPRS